MIGLTTGRQTSQRLDSLLKDLAHSIPKADIVRRGKSSLDKLAARLAEDGFNHALVIYRWHGSPGRMDFFEVQPDVLRSMPPSAILKSVKLRREYPNPGRSVAGAITCQSNAHDATRNFSHVLSEVLELPEVAASMLTQLRGALHVADLPDRSIQLALISPPAEREVGPKLLISRLLWDVNDASKNA